MKSLYARQMAELCDSGNYRLEVSTLYPGDVNNVLADSAHYQSERPGMFAAVLSPVLAELWLVFRRSHGLLELPLARHLLLSVLTPVILSHCLWFHLGGVPKSAHLASP